MMSARDFHLREEVILDEDEEDLRVQPGSTNLNADYDSDVIPAEKSFFYHDDEHEADLEEDSSEETAPNLYQDGRHEVSLESNSNMEADSEPSESTPPGGTSEQNHTQSYNVLVRKERN